MIELSPKQAEFAQAVFSGQHKYLMYGGAIRGGKTVGSLSILFVLCRVYPGSRWAIVRKDLPTLKRNTIPSFETVKPERFVGPINRTDWYVNCSNGSQILFFPESLREDPELNRWKGLEVNGFLFEEANECFEGTFDKAIERAGSWKCPERQPAPVIMLTCNPAQNWVKRLFYEPWKRGELQAPFFYLPATIKDNPHLDPAYLESLESLKVTSPNAYETFVLGNWDTADEPDQLIKYEWTIAARNVERVDGNRGLGVDVARYGDDDSVLCHTEGNAVTELEYFHGLDIERLTSVIATRIDERSIDSTRVMIDGVGLGAGVVDGLRARGFRPVEVISGAKAVPSQSRHTFKNLRSQMWWHAREELRHGLVCLEIDDPRLREDLTAPRYSVNADKMIQVESKDDIKKRIGRSTDAGDAFVYARSYGLNMSELEKFRRLAKWHP